MEQVRQWVFTICCGAMLCGIVSVLIPSKGMEKLMNMVLGLFMLCCFLLPAGMGLELPAPDLAGAESDRNRAAGEVTDYFLRDTAQRSEEDLRRAAAKELREYGIKEKDIQIYIETDEAKDDGSLGLIANFTLPERLRDRHDEIRRILEYELGVTVRLEYSREEP